MENVRPYFISFLVASSTVFNRLSLIQRFVYYAELATPTYVIYLEVPHTRVFSRQRRRIIVVVTDPEYFHLISKQIVTILSHPSSPPPPSRKNRLGINYHSVGKLVGCKECEKWNATRQHEGAFTTMEGNGQKTNDDGRERKSIDISGAAFESESPARSFTRLCVRTYAFERDKNIEQPDAGCHSPGHENPLLSASCPRPWTVSSTPFYFQVCPFPRLASPNTVHFFPLFRISNIFFPFLLRSKYESILSLSLLFRFLHLWYG